ncbi:chorismate mutase [Paracoccus sp. M683]|uniref:chorismate mutase n=1 Tax=Paracoccus sp. M683 TaxID=2594268 RepID=UPI00117BEC93|nr:chorismate mutase [Paracoccus sp. M683]TRW97515.1 chorismate mutase [Paracoccus sp. M683]
MTQIDDIPDMPALRARIDALDKQLVALLAERSALIDRAARIKARDRLPARIDARVEEVVANARRHAADAGLDADLIEDIWRRLIEAAIAQEDRHLKGDPA